MSDENKLMDSFLKENKEFHYNYEKDVFYRIPSGSLILDSELNGGFTAGVHRFCGPFESGKTSMALNVIKNGLDKVEGSKAVYVMAEGRLSDDIKKRSGIKFVDKPEDWDDGTCFIFQSNIYDVVVDLMRKLIMAKDGKKYFFIIDSVDGLITKEDLEKDFGESARVAGGPTMASHFVKKVSVAFRKFGHMGILISQVRANIDIQFSSEPKRQVTATGGNALLHFADVILEFGVRYKGDLILSKPSLQPDRVTNPIVGHWCNVTIKKSTNEKSNVKVQFPIKYGRTNGQSIWVEKEIVDFLLAWGFFYKEKKGAWYTIEKSFSKELSELGVSDIPEKLQGMPKIFEWVTEDEGRCKVLTDYAKGVLDDI